MVILRREWLWLVFCLAMAVFVVYMNEGHTYPPIALQELEQAEEENTVETAAESIPLLPQPELTVMAAEDYFLEYRLKRERARGQQAEMLWEIVQNPNTVQIAVGGPGSPPAEFQALWRRKWSWRPINGQGLYRCCGIYQAPAGLCGGQGDGIGAGAGIPDR